MKATYEFKTSSLQENSALLTEYVESLAYPMDSFVEDNLIKAAIHSIVVNNKPVGFLGIQGETLWFFYLSKPHTAMAQDVLEDAVREFKIKDIYFQTSDSLLVSLVMDWEFDKKKGAYFFQDSLHIERPSLPFENISFTQATPSDMPFIQLETNNFFDELDIKNGSIFMLRSGEDLLGCGISIEGRFCKGYSSIGMVTCHRFRKKGVGRSLEP